MAALGAAVVEAKGQLSPQDRSYSIVHATLLVQQIEGPLVWNLEMDEDYDEGLAVNLTIDIAGGNEINCHLSIHTNAMTDPRFDTIRPVGCSWKRCHVGQVPPEDLYDYADATFRALIAGSVEFAREYQAMSYCTMYCRNVRPTLNTLGHRIACSMKVIPAADIQQALTRLYMAGKLGIPLVLVNMIIAYVICTPVIRAEAIPHVTLL